MTAPLGGDLMTAPLHLFLKWFDALVIKGDIWIRDSLGTWYCAKVQEKEEEGGGSKKRVLCHPPLEVTPICLRSESCVAPRVKQQLPRCLHPRPSACT